MVEKVYPKLIQDFINVQKQYPEAVVLTEVGGFFEIWELDELKLGHAVRASQILDIALTRRDKSKLDSPRMAGFPSYTIENYIKKLVDAGETVVVVKQEITGKKSDNNKNVRRFVEKIVSPGTSIHAVHENKTNYFACCYKEDQFVGICLIDLTTGEVRISEMTIEQSKIFIDNNKPLEVLFCQEPFFEKRDKQIFHENKKTIDRQSSAGVVLAKIYDESNPSSNHSVVLSKIGIDLWPLGSLALANLLNFLVDYNPLLLKKISRPEVERPDKFMFLSKNAYMSLELFDSPIDKDLSKTLYGALDYCKTAMGRRMLIKFIQHPLVDVNQINERHNVVESFIKQNDYLEELKEVYDISRLTRRMALKNLMPHEIVSFCKSLEIANNSLSKLKQKNKNIEKVIKYIISNIDLSLLETGGVGDYSFYKGDNENSIIKEKNEWISAHKKLLKKTEEISNKLGTDKLKIAERQESIQLVGPKGIHSKCTQNKIEFKVKASEIQILDQDWEEIAAKEFYLKRKFVLAAEKQWDQFQTIIVDKFGEQLLSFSNKVGEIDVLSNFSKLSKERNYTRPKFVNKSSSFIDFKNMRHPVVEISKDLTESFVPNDISLNKEKNLLVIYGANSAGKSTILKSLALNIIMAQIGCYVASDNGSELSVFDSIMTRMTTYDSLSEGLSTFTMEMIELQNALKRRTENSLFLFDEIGRGTSVEDGEAIAFATLDYLNKEDTKCVTLFSTHYHALYDNIKSNKNVTINHMSCEIKNNALIFSRKLQDGPGQGSYGILVARSCGLPEEITRLADNYRVEHKKLIVSRYNSSIQGTLCELCNKEQAQETHHLIEQHQGKVEKIVLNGVEKNIHDKGNLVLICGSCHRKITNHKIKITKKKIIGTGANSFILDIEDSSQKDTKK